MILVGGIQLKKQQKKEAVNNLDYYVLSNITNWARTSQDGCEANFSWYFVFFLWLQLAFKEVAQIDKTGYQESVSWCNAMFSSSIFKEICCWW